MTALALVGGVLGLLLTALAVWLGTRGIATRLDHTNELLATLIDAVEDGKAE